MSPAPTQMEEPKIRVWNRQRKVRLDIPALQGFAERALTVCLTHPPRHGTQLRRINEISVLLISDRRMSGLHRRFLEKLGSTDVITFDHGEIFISVEIARKHARRFKSSISREIQLYIVHGLLHLHGFDDRSKPDAVKMKETQRKILAMARSPAGKD